jgi:hypothetical protein
MQDGFNHQTGQTTSTGTSLLVASGDARDRKTGRAIFIALYSTIVPKRYKSGIKHPATFNSSYLFQGWQRNNLTNRTREDDIYFRTRHIFSQCWFPIPGTKRN